MADIVLKGNTSGSITIASPDVSGVNVLTLPVETGTILTTNTPLPEVSSVEFAGAGTSSGNITITAPDTDETNTLTLPETTGTFATENSLGMRNMIINGNMAIDQRYAGASVTATSTTTVVDRLQMYAANITNAQTYQQVTDAPAGFNNSFKVTNSSTTQSGTNALYSPRQKIEGFNTAHLNWGTSDAQTVTLSFWVKASVTGTYPATLTNNNFSRSFVTSYTVSVANTWEYKTITIAGDTSGAWNVNNTTGINVMLSLDVEPAYQTSTVDAWQTANVRATSSDVHFLANASATWQITGLQLEAGTTATPFENLQYGQQLLLCQRYFEKSYSIGSSIPTSTALGSVSLFTSSTANNYMVGSRPFVVSKRAAPTMVIYSPSGTAGTIADGNTTNLGAGAANQIGTAGFALQNTSGGVITPAGNLIYFHFTASAEL